jgi:hypothetical protein
MKQNFKLHCRSRALLGILAIGLFVTPNTEAQTELGRQITFQDVLASVKTNSNSLDDFEKMSVSFHADTQRFCRELILIFTNSATSDLGQCAAAYYLGEIRDPSATGVLAEKIGLRLHWEKYPTYNFPDVPDYPAMDALIKIGNPSIPAVIRNLAENDDAKVRELSLQVLTRIDGDKDISQLRLQEALKAEKDSQKQARLHVALKSLANGQ